MRSGPIDLVTVSREYGAGGSEFAQKLGALLGWPVLDHDIVHRVAERLALDDAVVERLDEHPPTRLAELAGMLLVTPPESSTAFTPSPLLQDRVAAAAQAVIREAAESPPLVVVGHGAQCLFRDRPGTLHIRLIAPLELRVKRLCARLGCSRTTALNQARRMDEDRDRYVERHHHRDRRDPLNYDVVFNTGRTPLDDTAACAALLVRASREAPVSAAAPAPSTA